VVHFSWGMGEAKKNEAKSVFFREKPSLLKKFLHALPLSRKHSKDVGGSLEDPDVIKLCGCSRNSYYKHKKEAKSN
jgi:hypothetical protein